MECGGGDSYNNVGVTNLATVIAITDLGILIWTELQLKERKVMCWK
jgi:hypothetical protein